MTIDTTEKHQPLTAPLPNGADNKAFAKAVASRKIFILLCKWQQNIYLR